MKTKKKSNQKPIRVCGDCYHEYACFYAGGGCGYLTNTDATHCVHFETLTEILDKYAGIFGFKNIVRCKDCINAVNTGDKWLHCLMNRDVNGEYRAVSEFGFCSYGQRKISNDE